MLEVFKHTTSDWYPNYANDLVRVRLVPDNYKEFKYRISVYGADDSGVEKFYTTMFEAKHELLFILSLKSITREDLETRGFKHA